MAGSDSMRLMTGLQYTAQSSGWEKGRVEVERRSNAYVPAATILEVILARQERVHSLLKRDMPFGVFRAEAHDRSRECKVSSGEFGTCRARIFDEMGHSRLPRLTSIAIYPQRLQ